MGGDLSPQEIEAINAAFESETAMNVYGRADRGDAVCVKVSFFITALLPIVAHFTRIFTTSYIQV